MEMTHNWIKKSLKVSVILVKIKLQKCRASVSRGTLAIKVQIWFVFV